MSIDRKWPIARAEHLELTPEGDYVAWIAESRAGTGTWVIRQPAQDNDDDQSIEGKMFDFEDDGDERQMLVMAAEEREALGMSDQAYQRLNVYLAQDYWRRSETAGADLRSLREVVRILEKRIAALEGDPSD